ncbi:hypothetical protein [Streptomyces nogalater]|uniref:Uncharacterized protein n=1 Tax=Streptomyces nogalater TaxID=38314 RepID=A0ABW0WSD4_STRNO
MSGPGRYHLLLTVGGGVRPVQHGWWDREETGGVLADWPDQ